MMRVTTVALCCGLLALTTACGDKSVQGSKLEDKVSSTLAAKVGQKPDDVSCPHDLAAKKGATTRCTLTGGAAKYGVTVTTTSVDGGHVKFSIKVDDKPKS